MTASAVLELALSRAPTLGGARLICVDGPAGSGKTSLAASIAALHGSARVVHMDDLYVGWAGLAGAPSSVLEQIVEPLRQGRAGRFQRFDWDAMKLADWVDVPPADLLVIEGCLSGSSSYADAITALVWVFAPADERMRRGLARDGQHLRDRWVTWQAEEAALFARERTEERADFRVDGVTGQIVVA